MSDNSFTTTLQHSKSTENFAVYDGPELPGGQQVGGVYISLATFGGEPPEFLEVAFSDDERVTLEIEKASGEGNSIRYSSPSGAIDGMYVWPSRIDTGEGVFGSAESTDTALAPEVTARVSDQESFDAIVEEAEEEASDEAEALLAEADDSDDTDDSEEEDEQAQEAQELLEEAEEVAAE